MRITIRQLRRIIREALDQTHAKDAAPIEVDHPSEVEAEEDSWSGGENLVMPVERIKTESRRLRHR